LEVPLGVLLLPEAGPGDQTGGVVDAADQGEVRATTLQPVVAAAVDLEQHALARIAVSTLPMPGWPSAPDRGHPGGGEDAVRGGAGEDDAVILRQLLGEVLAIEAGVGAGR
jgi:hypothetical protein